MWYAYVYSIVGYLGNFEALHEITDLEHEMLRVYAPLESFSSSHCGMMLKDGNRRRSIIAMNIK